MPPTFLGCAELIKKVVKTIKDGWKYKECVYVFDKEAGAHYYETRLSRHGKTTTFFSEKPFPLLVDAEGNMLRDTDVCSGRSICRK